MTGFPPFCTENSNNEEIIKIIQVNIRTKIWLLYFDREKPETGREYLQIDASFQTEELDTKSKELKDASADFINFLEKTVCKDPANRLSASEALQHDWTKSSANNKLNATKHTFTNYKEFSKTS